MHKIFTFLILAALLSLGGHYYFLHNNDSATSVSKEAVTPGVTDTEILLGSSSALSGPAARLGINLIAGAQVALREINDAGGINGRQLKMVSYDDQYDPPKTVLNTQKLINDDKVFALFNYVGTPTGVKILPLVNEARIPLVGMFTGAEIFRSPVQPFIFNVRGSYFQETELATKYFVTDLGHKNIAVFYQADAFGLAGLEGAQIALKRRGLQPAALASYERNTLDVEKAVADVLATKVDAVIMIGTYAPLAKFVTLVAKQQPAILFDTVSFVGSEAFNKELPTAVKNVYVTQVVPPLGGVDAQFVAPRQYVKSLEKYAKDTEPTFGGLEGYMNTKVLAEGIRRAGRALTREGLIAALESLDNFDVGVGATLSYSASDHYGLDKVYLTKLINDQFTIVTVD
jgi:branched-chain amino acid transport system substrate-binding protein